MSLLIVIPYCKKDIQTTIRLLNWIKDLGGCPDNDCLMVASRDAMQAKITPDARGVFKSVREINPPFDLKDESTHPIGPNWMFETAIKAVNSDFLWLEPDAVPLKQGWLQAIETEYASASAIGRSILADVTELNDPRYPSKIPSGVAVYPAAAKLLYSSLQLNRRMAWDIQFANRVIPFVHRATSIQNIVNHNDPPSFSNNGHSMKLSQLRPNAVLFHPSKDGSLIQLLNSERLRRTRPRFYHSGDLGDVIYSLPTVKVLGGGDFFLGPDLRVPMPIREKFTPERAALIIPLLESQNYILSAQYAKEMPEPTSYDLNEMRRLLSTSQPLDVSPGFNLARCYLKFFNFDLGHDRFKWLDVPPVAKERVIINRSERYRDPNFRWDLILNKYRSSIAFIGLKHEHADFVKRWGPVSRIETKNLLEAAQVIAGAELFVGNQSCCYSIAEGLKQQAILEKCPEASNTLFGREMVKNKVWIGCDLHSALPNIDEILTVKKSKTKSFTVAGPVNCYTGLGRDVCKLVNYAVRNGYNVNVDPYLVDERLPIPHSVKSKIRIRGVGDDPRVLICPLTELPKYIGRGDVVMSMWESTRLPEGSVELLNKNAALLITPSNWCATVFSANGVNVPIEVVPLGCDLDFFKPFKRNKRNSKFVFGAAGRLGHGGVRKGIEDTIEAFKLAFPKGTEKVSLSLKLFEDCYIPKTVSSDKRISVIADSLSDASVLKWYQSIDCFVCLSKAEGWGNHVHEAMAMGIPVIAPCYSGLADLVPKMDSVPFSIIEATEGYLGHWCQPNIKEAASTMTDATNGGLRKRIIGFGIPQYAQSIINLVTE